MPQTASQVFEQAMDAEFTNGNLAEAIILYETAAQLYIDQRTRKPVNAWQKS